jgi:hypothetical protein
MVLMSSVLMIALSLVAIALIVDESTGRSGNSDAQTPDVSFFRLGKARKSQAISSQVEACLKANTQIPKMRDGYMNGRTVVNDGLPWEATARSWRS